MASGRKDLEDWLHALAVKLFCDSPAPAWTRHGAKLCTCLIVGLTLIVAPAANLAADVIAAQNNPKGDSDSTSVGWITVNTGSGDGPYHVTAVVTTSLTFARDEAAFALVILNAVLAGFGAFFLCLLVYKPRSAVAMITDDSPQGQGNVELSRAATPDGVVLLPGGGNQQLLRMQSSGGVSLRHRGVGGHLAGGDVMGDKGSEV